MQVCINCGSMLLSSTGFKCDCSETNVKVLNVSKTLEMFNRQIRNVCGVHIREVHQKMDVGRIIAKFYLRTESSINIDVEALKEQMSITAQILKLEFCDNDNSLLVEARKL